MRAADHGAHFIGSDVLHLDPDAHDFFCLFLEQEYPELLSRYRCLYGAEYAREQYQAIVICGSKTPRRLLCMVRTTTAASRRPRNCNWWHCRSW